MPHTRSRRLALAAIAIAVFVGTAVGLSSGTALAHNTLLSSDPADGATLAVAPTQITWDFDNSVPLETLTILVATGAVGATLLIGAAACIAMMAAMMLMMSRTMSGHDHHGNG